MRFYLLLLFTLVYGLLAATSVAFMTRTLRDGKQNITVIEKAAIDRLQPILGDLEEIEAFLDYATPVMEQFDQGYMLGLHEGYITVFFGADGSQGIKEITNTPADALPGEEIRRLSTGIQIENDRELSLFLQDYCS